MIISGISEILQLDANFCPVFFIYVLIKNGEQIVREKRTEVLNNIGKEIGEKIIQRIVEIIEKQIEKMEAYRINV